VNGFGRFLDEVPIKGRQLTRLLEHRSTSQVGSWTGKKRPSAASLGKVADAILAAGLREDPPGEPGLFRQVTLRCVEEPEEWLDDLRRCPVPGAEKREAPQVSTHEAAPSQKQASPTAQQHPIPEWARWPAPPPDGKITLEYLKAQKANREKREAVLAWLDSDGGRKWVEETFPESRWIRERLEASDMILRLEESL